MHNVCSIIHSSMRGHVFIEDDLKIPIAKNAEVLI